MTDERLKIWLNLIKWTIGTGSIVWVTTIINAGLNERKTGLDELKQYDKYVELITVNNKVGERRLLAQYFSLVTVSGPLRERWIDYYNVVQHEYDSLVRIDSNLNKLDSALYYQILTLSIKDSLNAKQLFLLREQINKQQQSIEKELKKDGIKPFSHKQFILKELIKDGKKSIFTYDNEGNIVSIKDSDGRTTYFEYSTIQKLDTVR